MSASKPEFYIPGAYNFDTSPKTVPVFDANIYLPPKSVSASTSSLARSVESTGSGIAPVDNGLLTSILAKRKRCGDDSRESSPFNDWFGTPTSAALGQAFVAAASEDGRLSGALHPHEYTLAGQISPLQSMSASAMEDSLHPDIDADYRRALEPCRASPKEAPDRGNAVRYYAGNSSSMGHWTVLDAITNVVGRVWDFCKSNTFGGFHAGGGLYDNKRSSIERVDVSATAPPSPIIKHPGKMASLDFLSHECPSRPSSPKAASRLPKRRQIGAPGDEIQRNWVMVGQQYQVRGGSSAGHALSSLSLPSSSASAAAATTAVVALPRKASFCTNTLPDCRGAARRSAQSAKSRKYPLLRSAAAVAAESAAPQQSYSRNNLHAGSSALSSRRPASFASTRSTFATAVNASPSLYREYFSISHNSPGPSPKSGGAKFPATKAGLASAVNICSTTKTPLSLSKPRSPRPGSTSTSPIRKQQGHHRRGRGSLDHSPRLDGEAKRLAAKKIASERNADAKIEAFNLRLKEMIKQGQEALGTTFEVQGYVDEHEQDGHWIDDDDV